MDNYTLVFITIVLYYRELLAFKTILNSYRSPYSSLIRMARIELAYLHWFSIKTPKLFTLPCSLLHLQDKQPTYSALWMVRFLASPFLSISYITLLCWFLSFYFPTFLLLFFVSFKLKQICVQNWQNFKETFNFK